jgi:hypothetical protein
MFPTFLEKMMTNRKLPFTCQILDTEDVLITNRYSGESVMLPPDAVAVYDVTMGAEMLGDYKTVRKGLDWFRRHFPAEYMVLLD